MSTTSPMLCNSASADEITRFRPEDWAADIKLDGWRLLASNFDDQITLLAGRNSANYSGQLPLIEETLRAILPSGTIVDGEIVGADGWGKVQGAMTRNNVHPLDDLTLVIFDVLQVTGVDVRSQTWDERRRLVEAIQVDGHRTAVSTLIPMDGHAFETALSEGFEGLVLKRRASRYVNGRSPSWVKIKAELSMECEIVALPHDGKGSFAGLVGAVEFMLPNGTVGRASGMTVAVRQDMTFHPEKYIGKKAEFVYQLITEDGRMRHPRYKRMRPDRDDVIVSKPKRPTAVTVTSDKPRYKMRNYKQMADPKLERSIRELRAGDGEAYSKCVDKGGDPAEDLKVAEAVAKERGLAVNA